ncbi:DUF2142 domain-containing protein [Homoserinimonas sp. A447]
MRRARSWWASGNTRFRRIIVAALVPAMFLTAFVAWAFSSPVGSSPDDEYHMASIWCAGGLDDLCLAGDTESERRVPAVLLRSSGCYAFDSTASASCHRQPIEEMINSDRGNFVGSYPPVFYSTMNIFASSDVELSVLLMRTFNALVFVGLVSALFFMLPGSRRGPLLWGSVATLVPLGMFIIPSVNPSSWAVLSGTTLWVSLVAYFLAPTLQSRVIFGAIALLVTVMGAGARSDSAVYSGIAIVVSVVLTFERTKRYLKLAIMPALLTLVALAFFFVSGQSSVIDPGTSGTKSTPAATLGLAWANLTQLPALWTGAMGTTGLGWLDTAMPATVWASTVAVFFGLAFWGVQKMDARKAIVTGIVFASLVIIPLYILVKDGVMVGNGVQPRYIYPLLIMIAGLALLGLRRNDLQLSRVQLSAVTIMLTVANSLALHTNIRRYVTGTDVPGPNLDADVEWWWGMPVSPMAVWFIGSVAFGLAMFGVYRYVRHSSQPVPLSSATLS